MKRSIIYVVSLGVICTALGVAGGVMIEKRYTARHFPEIIGTHLLRHPERYDLLRKRVDFPPAEKLRDKRRRTLERINRELALSTEQRDKVKALLEQARAEIEEARDGFRRQLSQIREKSTQQILEILNPEQKEKFQRMRINIERHREKRIRR